MTKYLIEFFWSDEDQGFIAIAPDLPGCSAFGDTAAEAVRELEDAQSA
jgi:predicted RNase H-like HicB family nuclease